MLQKVVIICLAFLCSCATSTSKEVKKDTKDKRDLPVLFYARAADPSKNYFINLREKDFFDYHEKGADGKEQLYAGTYAIRGNRLELAFQNNYYPEGLTNKGTIDRVKKEIVLVAEDTRQNRKMIISSPQ